MIACGHGGISSKEWVGNDSPEYKTSNALNEFPGA